MGSGTWDLIARGEPREPQREMVRCSEGVYQPVKVRLEKTLVNEGQGARICMVKSPLVQRQGVTRVGSAAEENYVRQQQHCQSSQPPYRHHENVPRKCCLTSIAWIVNPTEQLKIPIASVTTICHHHITFSHI
ncbi:unnamed protein product [Calypogeia fissa]